MDYYVDKLKLYKYATKFSIPKIAQILETNQSTLYQLMADKINASWQKKTVRKFEQIIEDLRAQKYTQFPGLFLPKISGVTHAAYCPRTHEWVAFDGEGELEVRSGRYELYDRATNKSYPSISTLSMFKLPQFLAKKKGMSAMEWGYSLVKQTPTGWVAVCPHLSHRERTSFSPHDNSEWLNHPGFDVIGRLEKMGNVENPPPNSNSN